MKIFKILTVISLILFSCIFVHADTVTENISVNVEVNSVFQLTLDFNTINFGLLDPGDVSATEIIQATGLSNHPNHIYINQSGDDFSNGTDTFTVESTEYTITLISGTGNTPNGTQTLTNVDEEIFRSSGNERRVKNAVLDISYTLTIPTDALVGVYSTTFYITMTE